ncbi:MAG TPA: SIS domain-containing protein [Caulobacteraceae bacterium]|jgi:D-sedoheptulose 7-phosphate isomerase
MSATDLSGFELQHRPDGDAPTVASARAFAEQSCDVAKCFFEAEAENLVVMARALCDVWRDGGRVFAMGLGASSCEAARFALQFQQPAQTGRRVLTAVDLSGDPAMMSGIADDAGFEQVFARQIAARARPGDGLIGFSTSGDTPSLIAAFAEAKARHVVTFGFTGGAMGAMCTSGLVDYCLAAPTTSAPRAQECHVTATHVLGDLVHTILAADPGSLGPDLH